METPEFFQTNYYTAQFPPEKRLSDAKTSDHFIIEDLLDFPNDDAMGATDGGSLDAAFTDSSTATPVDTSCNSSFSTAAAGEPYFQAADIGGPRSFVDGHFSNELCVPYDDLAELEWLSTFVDESFSSEDLQKLQLIQGIKARTNEVPLAQQYHFQPETTRPGPMLLSDMSVPAKARSKRSRAAPGSWTSRLLMVSPTPSTDAPAMSSSSESDIATGKKAVKAPAGFQKKKEMPENSSGGGEGRKCLHCATDKTPQWRTGPMGPKTLCNACGVRYKSGRLVPEYRPAASPTFVLAKHSNSHRKVLELRRQKEVVRAQQHQQQFLHHHHHHHQSMMFDVSNGEDYLIHQHIAPDYRQMI
ncbi:GATA transcription factor 12 [Perilla frutescens var. hirtella]|nr:GATA transcription factor 12 [Perilla frutescens var. hirtella]